MEKIEELQKIRKVFQTGIEEIDEIFEINEREKKGEDVTIETYTSTGKMISAIVDLQKLRIIPVIERVQ